jgi:hypothetical protein
MTKGSKDRGKAPIQWLPVAVLAALMTIPLAAGAAERMVLGEYYNADW